MKNVLPIKILHIGYYGHHGGSGGAVSMRRLHYDLKKRGVHSKVLCVEGGGFNSNTDFIQIGVPKYQKRIDKTTKKVTLRIGLTGIDGVRVSQIKKNHAFVDAGVINIHRLLGVTSYLGLPSLTRDKPTVLTLCDTWALTGRCYNNIDCERWQTGCGACPYQNVLPLTGTDGSHLEWLLKRWAYNHSNMVVVTKSSWMTEMLKKSILKSFPVYQIPNGIDVQTYKPLDKQSCRKALQIPQGKKVLMFSAVDLDNFIKGGDLLLQALRCLPASLKSEIIVLLVGKHTDHFSSAIGMDTINLGYIAGDAFKALAYSAADLFLCPSRGEVLGNVIIEAMSCGTPVVAFGVGGIPDLVHPNDTGYLAPSTDVKDFSRGIAGLLEDEALRINMSEKCRRLITCEFSEDRCVEKYLRVYKNLLNNESVFNVNGLTTNPV
jgi:glycosyltransferase involved in cell wall biosynthesis